MWNCSVRRQMQDQSNHLMDDMFNSILKTHHPCPYPNEIYSSHFFPFFFCLFVCYSNNWGLNYVDSVGSRICSSFQWFQLWQKREFWKEVFIWKVVFLLRNILFQISLFFHFTFLLLHKVLLLFLPLFNPSSFIMCGVRVRENQKISCIYILGFCFKKSVVLAWS